MAKTNSSFRLSKSVKRVLASTNFKNDDARNHYKKMMIDAEHTAAIMPKMTRRPKDEAAKE